MTKASRLIGLVASIAAIVPIAAAAQTQIDQKRKAYGSRAGNGDEASSYAGLNKDSSTSRRLDTRIRSRLDTRLDRYNGPLTNLSSTYTPDADDKTKK